MKYKVGDRVCIKSRAWIDAQEKDRDGDITKYGMSFMKDMFIYAGEATEITRAESDGYKLKIDDSFWWEDWMFDPDCTLADKTLSPKDAIRAMLDGEVLRDPIGRELYWDETNRAFYMRNEGSCLFAKNNFTGLYRRPVKCKRPMTRWEMLDWAGSEASRGWVVRSDTYGNWYLPQYFKYESAMAQYQRARLLPDLSGVDEDTIQGFEVEE
jgi:hypothetical protein